MSSMLSFLTSDKDVKLTKSRFSASTLDSKLPHQLIPATSKNSSVNFQESQDSNPELLGEKQECYLSALPLLLAFFTPHLAIQVSK